MQKSNHPNHADKPASFGANPPNQPPTKLEIISLTPPQLQNADLAESLTPIPAPSATLQYRAIGIIFGQYLPSVSHFCKGKLVATDGTEIEAVVLGRVMPIIQKKLISGKSYHWVVYPRTVNKTNQLYVQISGVWAPKETGKTNYDLDPNIEDGYFSIRGEAIEQSISKNYVVVKIKRSNALKKLPQARSKFKLKLKGILPSNALGYFWDVKVQREKHSLVITSAKAIAVIPKKTPSKPVRRQGTGAVIKPNSPVKPIKRAKN
ncbi:hypothetical protein Syn7502_03034 [Synechococcus sp. PCC 7502]|uniref:hypothetical protein n=1 Tax=Synechococcus sp. PCC 7502 TaxID=1173263 RepID=UPI00029FCE0E|nr:hypothetical protein [Synechococcus sp. PCC 7502]AFY74936.1 hypothetical protein Syn7502_03034 [Synechococcus sp. PCC 7502]